MTEKDLIPAAKSAVNKLREKNLTLALAESCTGGLVSKLITDISGASSVYLGGVCSYSNEVKEKLLGVSHDTLLSFGAVSRETALQMSRGVKTALSSDVGIGITGIAGPTSDGTNKPVGLIYISITSKNLEKVVELKNSFDENIREQNRLSAAKAALELLTDDLL